MAATVGTIKTDITLDARQFTSTLKKVETVTGRTSRAVKSSSARMEKAMSDSMRSVSKSMQSMATSIASIKSKMDSTKQSTQAVSKSMTSMASSTARASSMASNSITGMVGKITSLKSAAISTAGAVLTGFGISTLVGNFKTMAIELDGAAKRMKFVTGSASAAAEKFKELSDLGNRLGISTQALATSYGTFAAAARGTALEGKKSEDLFIAMSEASSVLGMTSEQTAGSMYALSQMMGGGTIRAEELFLQLNDRLPGAARIFADAIGVSQSELRELMKQGKLVSEDVLPKVAEKMHEVFGAEAQKNAKGLTAAITRSSNAYQDMKMALVEITEGAAISFFEALATAINATTAAMKFLNKAFVKIPREMSTGNISSGLGFITNQKVPEVAKDTEIAGFKGRDQLAGPGPIEVEAPDVVTVLSNVEIDTSEKGLGSVKTKIQKAMDSLAADVDTSKIASSVNAKLIEVNQDIETFYDGLVEPGHDLKEGIQGQIEKVAMGVVDGSKTVAEALKEANNIITGEQEAFMIKAQMLAEKEAEIAEKNREASLIKPEQSLAYAALETTMNSVNSAFETFIRTGKVDFKDMILSLVADIQKLITKFFVLMPLMNAMGIQGGAPAPALSGLGKIFGFAKGGVIDEEIFGIGTRSGKRYSFGEQGPEAIVPMSGNSASETISSMKSAGSPEGFGMMQPPKQQVGETIKKTVPEPLAIEMPSFQEKRVDFSRAANDTSSRVYDRVKEANLDEPSKASGNKVENINISISALDSKSVVDLMTNNPAAITGPLSEALELGERNVTSAIRGVL